MTRDNAVKLTRGLLAQHGLDEWRVVLSTSAHMRSFGLCDYKTKSIVLNALAVDLHPDAEVEDTIRHEIAHALTPGETLSHGIEWARIASELGARTTPCSQFNIPEHVIEAIRSGDLVEMEMKTIQIPNYKVTQLKEKCPTCGKPAIELSRQSSKDKEDNEVVMIILKCYHTIKKIIPKPINYSKLVSNAWKDEVKACKHQWLKTTCRKCGEHKLMGFQIEGATAIEKALSIQKGFGLFDDMGLGKTVQINAVVAYAKRKRGTCYIAKSALTFQWFKSIVTWSGPEFGGQIIRSSKMPIIPGLKTYIVSYDLLRRLKPERIEQLIANIDLVVLDECQQIKNVDSTRTQMVRKLIMNPDIQVIGLSGTPWKNRGGEFFPILNMIAPQLFPSQQGFLDRWVDHYWEGNKLKQGGIKNPDKFKEFTSGILLRREYEKVMDEFPEVNRMKMVIELDELDQQMYNDAVSDFVEWYNEILASEDGLEGVSGIELLGRMARMRHITGLAKIPATVSMVEEFLEETDRKLVIFVHHQDVGELLKAALQPICDMAGVPLMQYHSKLNDEQRFKIQTAFNESPRAILIGSTLAMGEGVNLQTCADSYLHERQWNPANEEQATPGRFKRIGQKSKVINNTIVEANDTIDQDIDGLVETKRINFHNAMNDSELKTYAESDFAKDLASRIVDKHRKATGGKKSNITKKARVVKQPQLIQLGEY